MDHPSGSVRARAAHFALDHFAKGGLREAIIESSILLGVYIVITSEIASLYGAVTYPVIASCWFALAVGLILMNWARRRKKPLARAAKGLLSLGHFDREERLYLVLLRLILSPTPLLALWAASNTWDAMTYHLARVAHWIDHGSVSRGPSPSPLSCSYTHCPSW